MSTTTVGLLAGLLLGVAAAAGGLIGFLVAVLLGAVGYVVGSHFEGRIDLTQLWGRGRG